METKKSRKANLENKRTLFFQTGMIITLAISLLAFEWSTHSNRNSIVLMSPSDMAEEDLIDITRNEPEKKEPPSPALTELNIVNNDAPDLDDPIFFDPTMDINEGIRIQKWTDMPDEDPDNTDQVFIKVEDMPLFNGGGLDKFWKYVLENVRYPEEAREAGLQGRIQVSFIVNEKGQIINIQLLRKIHPMLDNEVIKVLEESPLWTPGRQRNRPVKVGFSIPVIFKLSQ